MSRLARLLLRIYLEAFVLLAHDRAHARREHSLIEHSIHESYDAQRTSGASAGRAVWRVGRDHLAELSPLSLWRKTGTDARFAPHAGVPRRWPEGLVLLVGGLLVVATWRNRGDGDPVLVASAMAVVAAVVSFLFAVLGASRRHAGAAAIVLASGTALWPLWGRGPVMVEGAVSLGILGVALALLVVRRHGWSGVIGLAVVFALPFLLEAVREARPHDATWRGAVLSLSWAGSLFVAAFALWLMSGRGSQESARVEPHTW